MRYYNLPLFTPYVVCAIKLAEFVTALRLVYGKTSPLSASLSLRRAPTPDLYENISLSIFPFQKNSFYFFANLWSYSRSKLVRIELKEEFCGKQEFCKKNFDCICLAFVIFCQCIVKNLCRKNV